MCDRIRDGAALGNGFAAFHLNRHEFGRALAVAHDGLRQARRHIGHRVAQGQVIVTAGAGNARATKPGGDQHARVVGGGIAIHGDAVERVRHGVMQHRLQRILGHGGIGGDIAEHGRHVWVNHARAFGNAGDGGGLSIHRHLPKKKL